MATANVTVRDTISPTVTAAFVDQRTGLVVSQASKNAMVIIKAAAMNTCDPQPTVNSMVGLPVNDGEYIKVHVENQRLIIDDATQITLSVMATDASGNSATGHANLIIAPYPGKLLIQGIHGGTAVYAAVPLRIGGLSITLRGCRGLR
ncbi:hypothetical protein [Sulfuricaulis sp.]|uniref:hypothetical protein n=1 Tax=Sulfuricaulis sp. TaxID=2003553 RepID=UPI003559DA6D